MLAVGAHPDDIEIGCGGTLLRLVGDGRVSRLTWCVMSGDGVRRDEAAAGAGRVLAGVAEPRLVQHRFPDGYLPSRGAEVKRAFEELKSAEPDLVLVPRRADAHQDHRLLGELAWQTFRQQLVCEYEIPKYEGDLGTPNLFVELSSELVSAKVDLILETFASQRHRTWFDGELFRGLCRLRGLESGGTTGYAEGFTAAKVLLESSGAGQPAHQRGDGVDVAPE